MSDPTKIVHKYLYSDDYKVHPISGIFGALTPQGYVKADLFLEYKPNPDETTCSINEETGAYIEETEKRVISEPIIREFVTGLVMPPHVADSIGHWLIDIAKSVLENTIESE